MLRSLSACLALSLLAFASGCGSESDEDGSPQLSEADQKAIADGVPVGADGRPLPVRLDGRYELSTPINLTDIGVLPAPVSATLSSLSNFKEKPSQTIVDLLAAANVPGADVLNSIPGAIRGSVLGYMDDAIFDRVFEGVPVAGRIATLLDDVGSIAVKSNIVTSLEIPNPAANGDVTAKHGVRGLGFMWDGKLHVVDAPAAVRSQLNVLDVKANAAPLETRAKDVELGRLQLEAHKFAIPVGSFAVAAMDKMATDRFGADLRGSLGKLVDCKAIAKSVAEKCIDPFGPGKVCVGHEKELEGLCSSGLDTLVNSVKDQIKKLDITMDVSLGVAQMWDALEPNGALDARADKIDTGFWKASYKAFGNSKEILTTFDGKRVEDTAAAPK